MNVRYLPLIATIAAFIIFNSLATAGERLIVSSIEAGAAQFVTAKVYVADENWNLYHPQSAADFNVREKGVQAAALTMNCPEETSVSPCPVLLLTNSSTLTGEQSSIVRRLETEISLALPSNGSSLAASIFGERPYLLQDFTTNRNSLSNARASFQSVQGNNLSNAFLMRPAGALPLMQKLPGAKAIILITDSYGFFNTDSVIKLANALGVRIIGVSIGVPISSDINRVSTETGGFTFGNITSETRAVEIAHEIYWRLGGVYPCALTWKSNSVCSEGRFFSIEHIRTGAIAAFPALPSPISPPRLDVEPKFIDFKCVGKSIDSAFITLRATGGDATIYSSTSDNPDFNAIIPPGAIIHDGETRQLLVIYKPSDSLFTTARLSLFSDVCPKYIIASAGCAGQMLRPQTVKVISPNGGEELIAGDTAHIEWQGAPEGGIARAEYSVDGGSSWNFITEGDGLSSYDWIVPSGGSQRCLLRVLYFRTQNRQLVMKQHNAVVNTARFSPGGDYLATSSDDKYIRIFNTSTGALSAQFPFPGENDGVKCAVFSPNGKSVASVAGGNMTGFVLNSVTGAVQQKLEGHSGGINTCEYSADGRYLLTGGQDLTTRLWYLPENIGIASVAGHADEITGARFGEIISSSDADSINFFTTGKGDRNILSYTAVFPPGITRQQPTQMPLTVKSLCYSRVKRQFAVAFSNGTIRLTSNLQQQGVEFTTPSPINDIDFSPDGKLLVIACQDSTARIIDLSASKEVRVFIGHAGPVLSARFSPDGSRVATASADSSARIWDVNIGPIQSDTSDNFWRLGTKRLWVKSCDFGSAATGNSRDSLFSSIICNGGTLSASIDSIVIDSAASAYFSVSTGFPRVLSPDSCGSIRLNFSPIDERNYSALCRIFSGGRIARELSVTGRGIRPLLQAIPLIDFGAAEAGTFKDSSVRILIRNDFNSTLSLDSISFGNNSSGFALLDAGSASIAPGEARAMELRFAPLQQGRRSDLLTIAYSVVGQNSKIGTSVKIDLFGEGLCSPSNSFAVLSPTSTRIETESGKQITASIAVQPPLDIPIEKIPSAFSATLRFNASLLLPVADSLRGIVSGGMRTVKINGRRLPNQNILFSLDLYTAFGDADLALIELIDFEWPGCIPFAMPKPISVIFTDVCRAGNAARQFINGDKTLFLAISPNPVCDAANNLIEFGMREKGLARLILADMSGKIIRSFANSIVEAGIHCISADFANISGGSYFIVLETPTKVIATPITVDR